MVYIRYMLAELRRRRARTVLTALGLGVGIAIVIAVGALSSGLDTARATVLAPLTGVGTDMTVTRPISTAEDDDAAAGAGGFPQLTDEERELLREENADAGIDFGELTPGTEFSRTVFSSGQISFAASRVHGIAALEDVEAAAGGLTLSMTTISGTVPEQSAEQGVPGGPGGAGGPGMMRGGAEFAPVTVSGVDRGAPGLGAVTEGQVVDGGWFSAGGERQAIVDAAHAAEEGLTVGDTVDLDGTAFTVVGIAETPLGGQASDVYVPLGQLQALAGREGRVNTVYARAASADAVGSVAAAITAAYPDTSVATADALADSVTGSLVDAEDLTGSLGLALQAVGLLGAVLIASLLTLSSVAKRVRELGTLSAIGWPRRLVVRQVAGESLVQGLLGGLVGVAGGLAAAWLIGAAGPTLTAEVAAAGGAALPGPFGGGGAAETVSESVALTADVPPGLVLLAVGLAVAGGLVAGTVGGLRAARLRPADALRRID